MSRTTNRLEPLQMLTVTLRDGRTIQGVYKRDEAATRMAWAVIQSEYKSHTLIDWHCAWCDPRTGEGKSAPGTPPLTSGMCKGCEKMERPI